MTDRKFDQLLDAWMDLGPTTAPDRVAEAARLEARSTHQLPAVLSRWAPRRLPAMNNTIRILLAAAAVVVAVVIGYNYLVAPNLGGPGLFADPTPSPSPTPAPAADLASVSGELVPGPYLITDVGQLRITITLPAGWEKNVIPAMVWSTSGEKASVAYFTVTDLYADACDASQGLARVGPTVDDLAAVLGAVPGITIDAQTDVTISGYSGTLLELTTTDPGCDAGVESALLTSEPGSVPRPHPGGGDVFNHWYILDVDGDRLVINAAAAEGAPDNSIANVDSILGSTVIEPAP